MEESKGKIPGEAFRRSQLRKIAEQFRQRRKLGRSLGRKVGCGCRVLFSGGSGTGKTIAAELLAKTLDLPLYRVDFAEVVSKYIGETEKNLSRIFANAEANEAMLFFDEADALFGKRAGIKDSKDRYANGVTGHLFQRLESFEGLVIFATNHSRNLDAAVARRLDFVLAFPAPQPGERLRIWKYERRSRSREIEEDDD